MKRTNIRLWLIIAAAIVVAALTVMFICTGVDTSAKQKVGLIITGSIDDSGWNGMHYSGVDSACEKLGTKLLVKENVGEGTGECAEAIKELADEGAKMIILSSYGYAQEVADVIEGMPHISFYGIHSETKTEHLTTYFGRMYQARYLAGIVAGMQTENNRIGYVAAMPNHEVNRGINAFTLGVKRVNPEATVYVEWTNSWDDKETEVAAVEKLVNELDIDVVTCHQNQNHTVETADALGIYSIGYNQQAEGLSEKYLTAAVWNWDSLYYEIIREFLQGRVNTQRRWFGIERGVIELSEYSPAVSEETRQMVEDIKAELVNGQSVFAGDIYDNSGIQRCKQGESIGDDTLLQKMDWYVDGVVICA